MMNLNLLEIVACPICNNKLDYNHNKKKLVCEKDRLSFPLRDGIPVLLKTEAHFFSCIEKIL